MKLLKLTPDRLPRTRYFFNEGAPLPYLNDTVQEKNGIVRYLIELATTPNITERYRTRCRIVPGSTGHVTEQCCTVWHRPTKQTGIARQKCTLDGSKEKEVR